VSGCSFERHRVCRGSVAPRTLEEKKPRGYGQRRDHQERVVVDVSDDLRLPSDDAVKRGAAGLRKRTPVLRNRCIFEHPVDGIHVDGDGRMIDLGIAGQERGDNRDADNLWRVVDFELQRALLLAGVGWAAVPRSRVDDDIAAGRLIVLHPLGWGDARQVMKVRFVIARATGTPHGPAARWLFNRFALDSCLSARARSLVS
jgi:DNA-binding transcriptional LysR family regulator